MATGEDFNVGDIVKLRSGGPDMTVQQKDAYPTYYWCQWFAGKKLEKGRFAPESLERAAPKVG